MIVMCGTELNNCSRCGTLPDSARDVGQNWTVLGVVGQCRTVLESVAWALWALYYTITLVM